MQNINFLLVGVGGQGVLTASNILATAGMLAGYDVKKSEIHGMSQRGGNVSSHIRWGDAVFSPIIGDGETDYLLAFEAMEASRYTKMLKKESILILDDHQIVPITVTSGGSKYPQKAEIVSVLKQVTSQIQIHWAPGGTMADEMGNSRVANIILLGLLSTYMSVSDEIWKQAIARRVPQKALDLNYQAFAAGQALRGDK